MKIACWNVNSIKSRLHALIPWIEANAPDIILFQELKCEEEAFPYDAFSHLSYNYAISGQKTYNGVAIFSKYPIDDIKKTFPNNPCEDQARFVEISLQTPMGYSKIISVYVPNGGEVGSDKFILKLKFLDALSEYLETIKSLDEHIIIGGDFNVAPFDIDVYSPKDLDNTTCFTSEEKFKMRAILNNSWQDLYRIVHPKTSEYSWWDYRAGAFSHNHGMRIDMILGSPNVADKVQEVLMDREVRAGEKASDHIPVVVIV